MKKELQEEQNLIKPEFNEIIKAEVKGISTIENNIEKAKEYATLLNDYYKNIIFNEDTMKEATDEKAKINVFKGEVARFRIDIIEEFNKPIKQFEGIAKETESLLDSTYKTINVQVQNYNDSKKQNIENKLKQYFEEYRQSKNIHKDYVLFEELKINVTLSSANDKGELTKKSKEEVNEKVDSIVKELDTISTMQYKDEVLVEYLKNKDLSQAIKEVNDRHFILDLVRQKEVVKEEVKQVEEKAVEKVDAVIAPVEVKQEEIKKMTFKIYGTIEELKKVKDYLVQEGIRYE